jgi:hypothetical protein
LQYRTPPLVGGDFIRDSKPFCMCGYTTYLGVNHD